MTSQTERLALLAEEMGEAIQMIGKILRHGIESTHPDRPGPNNGNMLEDELGDVLAAINLLVISGDLEQSAIDLARESKYERLGQYLNYKQNQAHVAELIQSGTESR